MSDKQRIIDLQRQVRIARTALGKIANGHDSRPPYVIAEDALDEMTRKDKAVPLEGLLG